MALEIKSGNHPWSIRIWLLLAVLSNANGSILFFATFLPIPFSYILNVIYITCYRRYFHIANDDMPILIDLGVSLIFRYVVEFTSWKLATTVVFFLNIAAYYVAYFIHCGPEYFRLMKLNQENLRLKKLYSDAHIIVGQWISPLSVDLWRMAMRALFILQSFLLVFVWLFPFDEGFYWWYYQMFLGCYLVAESVVFFKCFSESVSKKQSYGI